MNVKNNINTTVSGEIHFFATCAIKILIYIHYSLHLQFCVSVYAYFGLSNVESYEVFYAILEVSHEVEKFGITYINGL